MSIVLQVPRVQRYNRLSIKRERVSEHLSIHKAKSSETEKLFMESGLFIKYKWMSSIISPKKI